MPLHIVLPKTSAYLKGYDGQTEWMDFLIENDDLLKKYINIWDKVCTDSESLIKSLIASLSTIKNC